MCSNQAQAACKKKKNKPFLNEMRLAVFSEEAANYPGRTQGSNRACYNFQAVSQQLPCRSLKTTLCVWVGLRFYDSHFTDNEAEDEKEQGHGAREAMEEVGTNRSFHNCLIIFSLSQLTFHKTRLTASPQIYKNISFNLS